ncbi:glutamate racemase [Hydrogenothermus marinus]|uniref:Glutamate racemase n=1 Tax=Hydrogenothermus marinus TaxID=133270 RepID=A0A3M0BDJ0_9AQUI|nr:glutamate racemase [Hydrogenothermus marinus]RMA93038.1 glutamate racemase [Hydrogenothermus marinus]
MSIGVFDSGIGGLTVFKSISENFPEANIYYIGDTARVPYGNKSAETIIRYSLELSNFLIKNFNVDLLVIACNSASSYAFETVKKYTNIPVIDVITAGVLNAISKTKNKKIGVIGTQATIRSKSYEKKIKDIGKDYQVFSKACPLFVPLVEEGRIKGNITRLIIKDYLDDIVNEGIDTLILGCTHYPLLKDEIKNLYPDLNIVDSTDIIPQFIKNQNINLKENGERRIFITDESPSFYVLKDLLIPDLDIEKVELSEICTL